MEEPVISIMMVEIGPFIISIYRVTNTTLDMMLGKKNTTRKYL